MRLVHYNNNYNNYYNYNSIVILALSINIVYRERPSVNAILRMPFVKQRIEKFLSETKMSEEFSHTILHNVPRPLPPAGGVGCKPSGPSVGPAREQPRGVCTVETG